MTEERNYSTIVRDLCNRRKNSDIRADDRELRQEVDAEIDRLRAALDARERQIEAFRVAIPQTYGDVKAQCSDWPPCDAHEWDNRTTAENAVWSLFTCIQLTRELDARDAVIKVAEEALREAVSWVGCSIRYKQGTSALAALAAAKEGNGR